MPKTHKTLVIQIRAYLRALEAGKAGYARANELLESLTAAMIPGLEIRLSATETAVLQDKFAVKNRIGAGLGVNRYEIEVSRVSDVTSKL